MPEERQRARGDFCVVIYYAPRSYVEIERPIVVGSVLEVAIAVTAVPPKLATAAAGDRIRIQLHGVEGQTSPILGAIIAAKAEEPGSHRLKVRIEEWDKLARYWRARFEAGAETE